MCGAGGGGFEWRIDESRTVACNREVKTENWKGEIGAGGEGLARGYLLLGRCTILI